MENKILKFENHPNYNCEITTSTGQTYQVFANWLHNSNLDSWQGWHCQAGSKRLYIDKNLEVFGGMCCNDKLGNAVTGFDLLDHSVCRQTQCTGCTDDLQVEKHKLNNS